MKPIKTGPWKGHCGGMSCGDVPTGSRTMAGCQCFCVACETSRPAPTPTEADRLRARLAHLEGFLRALAKEMARQGKMKAAGEVLSVLADPPVREKKRRKKAA